MQTISIHAPREGGDSSANRCRSCWIHFNPRPPRGGRLLFVPDFPFDDMISIHAPREGGDRRKIGTIANTINFNPRPPRGGRRQGRKHCQLSSRFQSTPPARGATLMNLRRGSRYF